MNPNDIVLKLISALNQVAIPYMIVGSFSSNIHGIERNTVDADLVLQLDAKSISPFIEALGPDFSFDPQLSFETVTMTYRYIVAHRNPFFKIELFLLSEDAHDTQRFKRRMTGTITNQQVHVASAEDVVVTKLRWSKQGKRSKDIEDVRGVLSVQKGKLDLSYIRYWCNQHGTTELLDQLLNSISHLPDAP